MIALNVAKADRSLDILAGKMSEKICGYNIIKWKSDLLILLCGGF